MELHDDTITNLPGKEVIMVL